MNASRFKKLMTALLVVAAIAVTVPASLWAAGTIAGTGITNSVSVGYTIGGVPGSAIVSSATFTVGVRVNMTVARANAGFVDVAGGATGAYLTFVVSNVTNTRLDFGLVSATSTTEPFGGAASNFVSVPILTAYVDVNGNGIYEPLTDITTFSAINTDASVTVFLVGNIPASEANGAIQAYSLTAVARQFGSGAGAVTNLSEAVPYNGVDVVFGDPDNSTVPTDLNRDARSSDRNAFRILSLTVSKTSAVYSDPFNGTGAGKKAIPGAVITYTVTITNPGSSAATSVSISDALGALPVTFAQDFNDGAPNCGVGSLRGIVINGACFTNGADGGTPDASFAAGTVSVSGMTIGAGTTTTIKYQITVN